MAKTQTNQKNKKRYPPEIRMSPHSAPFVRSTLYTTQLGRSLLGVRGNYQEESTAHNRTDVLEQVDWRSRNHCLSHALMIHHHNLA